MPSVQIYAGTQCSAGSCMATGKNPTTPVEITAGGAYSCVRLQGGQVKCWGDNFAGQLGDGTTTSRSLPSLVPALADVTQLDVNATATTCARTNDARVLCWGENMHGDVGDGETTNVHVTSPTATQGLRIGASQVSPGLSHTCALLDDHTVACWGSDLHGQLGDGNYDVDEPSAQAVANLVGVRAVSAALSFTCALMEDGTVMCWGKGLLGELGNGNSAPPGFILGTGFDPRFDSLVPVPVQNLTNVVAMDAAVDHACAVRADGTVWCWGTAAQPGGISLIQNVPAQVQGVSNAISVSVGGQHACAVLSDGTVTCWGSNFNGQLGDGTTTDRPTAAPVTGLTGAVQVAAGGNHTCAVVAGGAVFCWGGNASGQLGDGTTNNSPVPVALSPAL
jgi:alpha-tubulin suppressor-like RCC1 family protein